jgi:hypothetical protein
MISWLSKEGGVLHHHGFRGSEKGGGLKLQGTADLAKEGEICVTALSRSETQLREIRD